MGAKSRGLASISLLHSPRDGEGGTRKGGVPACSPSLENPSCGMFSVPHIPGQEEG